MQVVVKVPVEEVGGFVVNETLGLESTLSVAEHEQVIVCPVFTEVGVQEKVWVGAVLSTWASKVRVEYPSL